MINIHGRCEDEPAFFGRNIRAQILKVSGPETRITAIPPTPGAVDIAQIVLIPSIKPLLIHTLENPVRFLPHNVGRLASSYPDESNGIYPLPQGVREDESRLIYYLR